MMRIALITHSHHAGGAARYGRDVAAQLLQRGHQVSMLTADPEANTPAYVRPVRLGPERWLRPLELLPGLSDWRHRGSIRRFGELGPHNVDLVHLNLLSGGWCSLRAVADLCRRVPTVWMHHDEWAATGGIACLLEGKVSLQEALHTVSPVQRALGVSPYHASWKSRNLAGLMRRCDIRPALHLCPSRHMADLLGQSSIFDGQATVVIPHGTSLAGHPAAAMPRLDARRRLNVPAEARVILMMAHHVHDLHKGFALGLEALRALQQCMPLHVLVMGRGAQDFATRLAPIACTCGYAADDEQLAQAYRAADLTLIPSLAESFCYVAIESLACQTPFVSFRVGGLVEIAQDEQHGLLADCFEAAGLMRHLQELLSDEGRRQRMGESGRQWVGIQCTLAAMTDRLLAAYEQAQGTFAATR